MPKKREEDYAKEDGRRVRSYPTMVQRKRKKRKFHLCRVINHLPHFKGRRKRSFAIIGGLIFIVFYSFLVLQHSGVSVETQSYQMPPIIGTPPVLQVEAKEKTNEVHISDEDYEWLLRVVAAESLNQGYTGQRMVAGVIIGRMQDTTGDFRNQKTIKEVVTAKGQFACVSDGGIYRHKPSEETIRACQDELANPQYTYLKFFRTGHYGYGTPVMKYRDHYFSK